MATATNFVGGGLAYPLAVELAGQMNSGVGKVGNLMNLGMEGRLATEVARQINAASYSPDRLAAAGLDPVTTAVFYSEAVGSTGWVLRGSNNTLATLDADYQNNRFFYNGGLYVGETALNTAIGFTKSVETRVTAAPYIDPALTNLLPGGDFASGTTGFTAFNGASISNVGGELQIDWGGGNPAGGVTSGLIGSLLGRAVRMSITGRRGTSVSASYAGAGNINAAGGGGISTGANVTPTTSNATQTWFATAQRNDGFYASIQAVPTATGTAFVDNWLAHEAWPYPGWTPNAISGVYAGPTPSALPSAAAFKVPLQMDIGLESNRIRLQWGDDAHLRLVVTCSNSTQASLDLGVVAAGGTAFNVAFSLSQLGTVSASLNGGVPVTAGPVLLPGVAYARIGRSLTGETWDAAPSRVTIF